MYIAHLNKNTRRKNMKSNTCVISIIFAFLFYSSAAQIPDGMLEVKTTSFSCNVKSDLIKISLEDLMTNEIIVVNGKVIKEASTYSIAKNGKQFELKLPFNHKFKAIFSDVGCETKTIFFDTNVPQSDIESSVIYSNEFNLNLSSVCDSSNNKNFPKKSAILFKYKNEDEGHFVYNNDTVLVGDIYYNLGVLKLKKEDYTGAIKDFTSAIEFNSADFDAFYNRCVAKIKSNDLSGGCSDLQTIKNENKYDIGKLIQMYCH